MRKQPKLFGGSEVTGPAARPSCRPAFLFGQLGWIEAAQDWCRERGLTITHLLVNGTFRVGSAWYSARWDGTADAWVFERVG